MQPLERALVRLDESPWAQFLRVIVGCLVVPVWSRLTGGQGVGWTLLPFFLSVLVALRVAPAVLRRLFPFSGSVQATWAERRQLARRFDSYQWQKLFWIGLGLLLYISLSADRVEALVALTVTCLFSGTLGLAVWQYRVAQLTPPVFSSREKQT